MHLKGEFLPVQAMKAREADEMLFRSFLSSAVSENELEANRPGRNTSNKHIGYPLNMRLIGPQRRQEGFEEERHHYLTENRKHLLSLLAFSLVTISTALSRHLL